MPDEPRIEIHRVKMLDTGIGREAGFRDDEHLIEVAKAERDAMSPEAQEMMRRIDIQVERAFLFGSDA